MATVTLLEKVNSIDSSPTSSEFTFLKDEIIVVMYSIVEQTADATSGNLVVRQYTSPQNQFFQATTGGRINHRIAICYLKLTANYTGRLLFQWLNENSISLNPDRTFFYIYKISSKSGSLSYVSANIFSSNSTTSPALSVPATRYGDIVIAGGSMLTFNEVNSYMTDTDTTAGSWSTVEHVESDSYPKPNTFSQYKITTGADAQSYGGTIANPYSIMLVSAVFRETGGPYWGISA